MAWQVPSVNWSLGLQGPRQITGIGDALLGGLEKRKKNRIEAEAADLLGQLGEQTYPGGAPGRRDYAGLMNVGLPAGKAPLSPADPVMDRIDRGFADAGEPSGPMNYAAGLGLDAAPASFRSAYAAAGDRYGVDPTLLVRQGKQESGWAPDVISGRRRSSAGATGIAQFMPGTAADMGIDPTDPLQSIDAQGRYMAQQEAMFGENQGLALAAYNWGPARLKKWLKAGSDPNAMPAETRNYVRSISGKPIEDWIGSGAAKGMPAEASSLGVQAPKGMTIGGTQLPSRELMVAMLRNPETRPIAAQLLNAARGGTVKDLPADAQSYLFYSQQEQAAGRDPLGFLEYQTAGRRSANQDDTYTLGPGQTRFDQAGKPVASVPASDKPSRPLPQNAINALTEAGSTYEDFRRLSGSFDDGYGGFISDTAGNAANWSGRNLPGTGFAESAQWWQDYQNQKNIVRNKLFGSALTATEKGEFDKANITPGMQPTTIRANLQLQHDAALRAAKKLAQVQVLQGYSPDVIEAAIGLPLGDIGVDVPDTGGGTPVQMNGKTYTIGPDGSVYEQ